MKKASTTLLAVALMVATLGSARGQSVRSLQAAAPPLPNVLLIVVDDQSSALFNRELMPQVFAKIVDRGIDFDRGYVNTSQCCPSRSQILTGLYGHHNGVDGNHVFLQNPTFIEKLKDMGYRTALTGKYLNSWPCTPKPEFDLWACIEGSHEHASLVDPEIYIGGVPLRFKGYQSEVLTDLMTDFIEATPDTTPFFGMYTTTSPHMPADDTRYEDLEIPLHRTPSFDEDTVASGKPLYAQREALTPEEIVRIDEAYRKMSQATRALDDSIARLLKGLGDRASNTLVMYISDNGYLYGEHRLTKKVVPYEESVRVPFAARFPTLGGPQGLTSHALVQNVDIAPTIIDATGEPWGADGASLLPLLSGDGGSVRDAALIENCQAMNYPCEGTALRGARRVPSYWGIVTDRYKYVEYYTGERELYDLTEDPYELTNLSGDPGHAAIQEVLATQLMSLHGDPPAETTLVSGPRSLVTDPASIVFRYFTQSRDYGYECRVSGDQGTVSTWFACPYYRYQSPRLANGTYLFEVRAARNGLFDPTPASRTFTVQEPVEG